ncbi:putative low affinity copper uptake protein 2 [Toxocara canis]|uniref:Copper transport protein n=1 Tax=Toxocara canis TaxID=6265 RepID=A0A0B2UZW2_TOXCA|nr:putative low affinity copper uptake protein 2 [Toxocara canis]
MAEHSGHHSMVLDASNTANDTFVGNISDVISSHLPKSTFLSNIDNFLSDLTKSSTEMVAETVDHSAHTAQAHAAHATHDHSMMDHHMNHMNHMNRMGNGMMGHAMEMDSSMSGHSMMKMWFHGGYDEVILFDFWRINSLSGLLLSCLLIFVMASLYEGIKWFRVYLQMSVYSSTPQCDQTTCRDAQKGLLEEGHSNGGDVYALTTTPPLQTRNDSAGVRYSGATSPFSPMRIIQALLYLMQLTLAYWLMLIVMTYNSWLTAAVVVGAAFGHWLFAVLKCLNPQADHMDTFATDACH